MITWCPRSTHGPEDSLQVGSWDRTLVRLDLVTEDSPSLPCFLIFFFFESHSIVQAGLKFTAVLSQLPQELEVEPLTVSATS